ncbi:MAG: M6 family metalloprotease domain-containing protein, partial [Planctomycetes bacterium]|nr:M6 family metalloprotease domain-containing protein [Planctomycetota bacterium]
MFITCRPVKAALVISGVLVSAASLSALQPPRPGEREQYLQDGTWAGRLENAVRLGNHRVAPHLVQDFQRRLLGANGGPGTPADPAAANLENAPPPDWQGGLPATGTPKVFVLLVDFSDQPRGAVHTVADVTNKFFGNGNPGSAPYESLRNYYQRASYSQLTIQGTVFDWYRAQYPRSYYEQLGDGPGQETLMMEAMEDADARGHDFTQYDNDGDGTIDALFIKWTGPDNGWANFWWAYQWYWHSYPNYRLDGKKLGKYVWSWIADAPGLPYDPHVDIHETGHLLGLPDLYDYDGRVGPDGGVGGLDMMDYNWGDHNCFSKYMLGWLTPTEVLSGTQELALRPSGSAGDCVLTMSGIAPGTLFGEFFMVQYRKRNVGNDPIDFPSDGFLIWHVDSRLDSSGRDFQYDNSYTAHKYMRLMEADGLEEIEKNFWADAGDFYVPGRSFGPQTLPNSATYAGQSSGVWVDQLTTPAATMSGRFRVASGIEIVPGDLTVVSEGCPPANKAIDPDETVTVNLELRNTGWAPTTNLRATLVPTGGVTLPSGTQTYGKLVGGGAGVSKPFTFTASGTCGELLTLTLQLEDAGKALDPVTFSRRLGSRETGQDFDAVTPPALPTGWSKGSGSGLASKWATTATLSDSAPNCVYTPDPDQTTDSYLVSPSILIESGYARLTFRQRYELEDGKDGGALEIAIGAGAFLDILEAGGAFVTGGYNGYLNMLTPNPLAGRQVWTGSAGEFITTTVVLPPVTATQSIRLRWRLGTSPLGSGTGWYVDTIQIEESGLCCDPLGIVTSPNLLTVPENSTATMKVKLASQPTADTIVTIAPESGDPDVTLVGPGSLTFTPASWSVFQSVTFAAAADLDADDGEAVFRCSAPGLHDGLITVIELDDDKLAFVVNPGQLSVPEGGTASFGLRLAARPLADVAVTVGRIWGDADLTVQSGSSLTFTTANWDQDQTVVVAAAQDPDASNGQAAIRCAAPGVPPKDVLVTEMDDEIVAIVTSADSLRIDEGTTVSLNVKLAKSPVSPLTVTVNRIAGDESVKVVTGSNLRFTTANWDTWQLVLLRAEHDADFLDGQATLRLSGSGVLTTDLPVTTVDKDTLALVLSTTALVVPEGQTAAFSVRLGAQPLSNVTVTCAASGDPDISVAFGGTLVFTPANWSQFQPVTLFAAEDNHDVLAGQATIECSAAGLPSVFVRVTEADNDSVAIVTDAPAVTVPEGGTAQLLVSLNMQPPATATVTVSVVAGDPVISVRSGSLLTFTPANWNV